MVATTQKSNATVVNRFEAHVNKCQLQKFTFDYYMHGIVEESGEVFDAVRAARSTDTKDISSFYSQAA